MYMLNGHFSPYISIYMKFSDTAKVGAAANETSCSDCGHVVVRSALEGRGRKLTNSTVHLGWANRI